MYAECLDPEDTPDGLIIPCAQRFKPQEATGGGGALAPGDVTDAKSTGRKRAALLAPIMTGMLCEWAGLRQAGGGVVPIVGCAGTQLSDKKGGDVDAGYLQGDRHHGPDKGVLNNALGTNLHRICVVCHHRWHAVNDEYFSGTRPAAEFPYLPEHPYHLHDPNTEAAPEEQEIAETWWASGKKKDRGPYPIVPEDLRKIAP